ncbi:probable LIM domain-containing serine/threonine-protein kinase DDB_G0287001 [Ptychodera flava]|uniref:probable LIM domain-containing serine/threonine-protein kinase DDB_G0287001 n=1 Tax=Ptychodera flava TaxID=63121 RepID=UPI00396AA6B9
MAVSHIFMLFLPTFLVCVDPGVGEGSNEECKRINDLIDAEKETAAVVEIDDNSLDNCVSDEDIRVRSRRRNVIWRFFNRVRKRISRLFGRNQRNDETEFTEKKDEIKVTKKMLKGKESHKDVPGLLLMALSHLDDLAVVSQHVDKDDIYDLMKIKAGFYSNVTIGSIHDHKQLYVLKYLSNEEDLDEDVFKQIMENEIHMNRVLTKLNNDNFVRLIGLCRKDEMSSVLVLEYVRSLNLKKFLYRYGETLPLVTKYDIMLKMTNSLKALHKVGIIHNDLKLSNILLQLPEMSTKLIDFAYSCFAKTPKFNGAGSMMYAPPEVFKMEVPPCNKAKDIWALGCCMAQLVTLETTYDELRLDNEIIEEITAKLDNGEPVTPLNVSMLDEGEFKNLCQRCCDMTPANRPTAKQVSRDLQKLIATEKDKTE